MTGHELGRIAQAHANGHLSGDGVFTKKCNAWLEAQTGARKALLTNSKSVLLDIGATSDIAPGDIFVSLDGSTKIKITQVVENGSIADVTDGAATVGQVFKSTEQ